MVADRLGAADKPGIDRADNTDRAVACLREGISESLDQLARRSETDLDLPSPGIVVAAIALTKNEIAHGVAGQRRAQYIEGRLNGGRLGKVNGNVADALVAGVLARRCSREHR